MANQIPQLGGVDVPSQADALTERAIDKTFADVHEARLGRVLDYQAGSLAKEDALEANLGSINSGLMRVALWLDETIEEAMESGPRTVERLQRILPAIDTHLRVTRQVDRFAQIELRASGARKRGGDNDTRASGRLDASSAMGISQSEDS
jgi:hypothetical protein